MEGEEEREEAEDEEGGGGEEGEEEGEGKITFQKIGRRSVGCRSEGLGF